MGEPDQQKVRPVSTGPASLCWQSLFELPPSPVRWERGRRFLTLAVLFVEFDHLSFPCLDIPFVEALKLVWRFFFVYIVECTFGKILVVDVPTAPRKLNNEMHVRIMLQSQLNVVLDAFIGKGNRRHDEYIDFASLESFLRLILVVWQVPMLKRFGSTERLKADKFMSFDLCGMRHLAKRFWGIPHKAVGGEENSQSRWCGSLVGLPLLR
jgi:hypothetical protein